MNFYRIMPNFKTKSYESVVLTHQQDKLSVCSETVELVCKMLRS